MNPVERLMRRRNMQQYINEDPVDISFIRQIKTETPAGGWTVSDAPPLAPQRGRIIPAKRRYADMHVNTEAGQIALWPYILIGFHNMNIQEDDRFVWLGNTYQVKSIEPDREERTQAAIDFYGGPNG